METAALTVILVVAVGALARIVWRAVTANRGHDGACCRCPLASSCDSADTVLPGDRERPEPGHSPSQCGRPEGGEPEGSGALNEGNA